jgi:hypothetical protein
VYLYIGELQGVCGPLLHQQHDLVVKHHRDQSAWGGVVFRDFFIWQDLRHESYCLTVVMSNVEGIGGNEDSAGNAIGMKHKFTKLLQLLQTHYQKY